MSSHLMCVCVCVHMGMRAHAYIQDGGTQTTILNRKQSEPLWDLGTWVQPGVLGHSPNGGHNPWHPSHPGRGFVRT